jgi:hypothetical protein
MEHAISLFFRSIFVDNMIFAYFLGMCSYLAVSKNVKTSLGLGLAVTFVLLITVPVDYLLQTKVLSADGILGVDLTYLALPLFHAHHTLRHLDLQVALHLALASQTPVVLNLLAGEVRLLRIENLAAALEHLNLTLAAACLTTAG